jgi:hypothetical protein
LKLQSFLQTRSDARSHLSVAGAVAWVWLESKQAIEHLDQHLLADGGGGLLVLGDRSRSPWLGQRMTSEMENRLSAAMDPNNKFASWSQA